MFSVCLAYVYVRQHSLVGERGGTPTARLRAIVVKCAVRNPFLTAVATAAPRDDSSDPMRQSQDFCCTLNDAASVRGILLTKLLANTVV